MGIWYLKDSPFDLVAYTDSDYAGASLDRKSTTGVNAARHNLLLLLKLNAARHNLLLLLKVNASRHKLTTDVESENCEWEVQLQALMDEKKIIVTEASVRRDLQLNDEEGTDCLPNATIFEELTRMGYEKLSQKLTFYKAFFSPQWKFLIHTILQCLSAKTTAWNEFSSTMASNLENVSGKFLMYPRFMQVFLEKQLEGMQSHKRIYVTPSHTKNIFRNMRRVGKGFSRRETPLFPTMMVQAQQEQGEGSANPTDPHHIPTIIQPSTYQPQKKQRSRRPKRKDTEVPQPNGPTDNVAYEAVFEEIDDSLERAATTATSLDAEQDKGNINKTQSKATPNEPSSLGTSLGGVNTPRSNEDSMKLKELMEFCTKLQQRVLNLENTKTAQAQEIISLKLRVKKLEKKEGKIDDIDKDAEITLVHETHGRYGDKEMFDTDVLDGDEVLVEPEVTIKDVNLSVDEVTLAQVLAALKSAKVQEKANVIEEPSESITTTPTLTTTTTATTITAISTRPRAKGLVIHKEEQATTLTVSSQQPSQVKAQDKGKGIMVEEPVKMKKKDQISLDEELAFKLQAEEEEEERLAKEKAQREEEANIVAWDNVQARIDVDYQMAKQMQAEEQEKLSIEEKSKLFVQLLEARKKHFAAMKAHEKRNKPPTKAQKRNTMSTYLKNIVGYKNNQLKNKSFNDIQKLFGKAMKRVNTFVDMDTKLVEGSEVRAEAEIAQESSSKRAGTELEQESIKKQKVDDKEEVAIDAIPLATKPPSIVDYKIHKEGKNTYYQIIRADRSSKMYLVFSHMLKSFDREDLETMWKLVKAKHGSTRPGEGYERVLWGDLKIMFNLHVEDQVWKNQQDYRVLDWKLYDSCGVHLLRKQNVHIHMLVEKRYPFTPTTIIYMLNRKLQACHWNEMSSYVRALIEVQADVELKHNIMVAMPKLVGDGFYTCTVRVEYEWKPPRCACCKVFGHVKDECPKIIKSDVVKNMKKPSQTPRGVLVGPKVGFQPTKQVYRQVPKKNIVSTSGNKKKYAVPTKEVSTSNSFDVLNLVKNDVDLGTNGGTLNMTNKKANSSGSSYWNVESSNTSTTPIVEKIDKMERLIIDGTPTLVDDEGIPLKRVDSSSDHDSDDEVASVDNDMANFLASKDAGYGTNSLLEQWNESYGNGKYDYDPYDDGEPLAGVTTRSRIKDSEVASAHECLYVNFLSKIEPKKLIKALEEEGWIIVMQEEMDEIGVVIKNKARLVAQGFRQEEGIDYNETFALVARLKFIRIFLAYASYMGFMMYQIDVKIAFLNGKILEEVYVQQLPRFESREFQNYVFKLDKDLYWLKQAPRACNKKNFLSAKKQSSVAMSSAEVKYVVVAGCYAQCNISDFHIKSQLADYDVLYEKVPIFCDNAISNNLVLHSRTKLIDIRYHFIRDYILKGDIELHFIPTDMQLADIFTKPLAEHSFTRLVAELGMLNIKTEIPDKKKALSDPLT
ncbi:retrovirus-related pol polyprotein from transposon TNT 1-94 [Tanacetum coccineum]